MTLTMNTVQQNGMQPMVNGANNGLQRDPQTLQELKTRLNTHIYDYFLRNEQWDLCRRMVDSPLKISTSKTAPPKSSAGENGEDSKDDWESRKPGDIQYPAQLSGQHSDEAFLLDWFSIFWEMFLAPRNSTMKVSQATTAYMQHQKEQQQLLARQNGMTNGMMGNYPVMGRGHPGMGMVGRQIPQQVMGRPINQAQQQLMMQQQQTRNQQQHQLMQQQMGREGADVDMNGPDMNMANFNFQGANKKNLEAYSQNMAQTTRQGMQQNMSGQIGQMQGQELQEFYNNSNNPMQRPMPQNGQGNAQQGNHALQDYQMQLMLLEQQNKKRLLMARQEQDQVRPGDQPMAGQGGFAPNMSPQGSRSGPSPNPSDQMKRGTPKMGQAGLPGGPNSPMPDGNMVNARGSPGQMNFNGMEMMQGMKGADGMPLGPGMRPPSSHPGFNGPVNPAQMEAMRRGQLQNGANWQQMAQGQAAGMPQGGQPGQQMGTPQQRNANMPPPQNVPVQNGANGRPPSPAQSAAAGTPQPANKAAPAKKGKGAKETKKQPQKKGTTAATPSADDNPPQTPTPATPITPMHAASFNKDGKPINGLGQPVSGQQHANVAASAAQLAQPHDVNLMGNFDAMEGLEPNSAINMQFSGLDTGDVLEQFDFDAFLDTGDNDLNFDAMAPYTDFQGLEAGTGDA